MLLIKLPDFLYQVLQEVEQTAEPTQTLSDVGVISVNEATGDCEIQLNSALQRKCGQVAIKMHMQPLDQEESLYVFTVDGQGRAVLKCPLVSKMSIAPGLKAPMIEKTVTEPETQIGIYNIDAKAQDPIRRRVFHLHPEQKLYTMMNSEAGAEIIARKERSEKRVRGDKDDIKSRLFDLFHKKKYWKTKALADETDQPDQFINEILAEIADKVEQGPHRKCWKLKAEYRGGNSSGEEEEDEPQKKRRV